MALYSVTKLTFFLVFCAFVNFSKAGVTWSRDGGNQLSRREVAKISRIADKTFKEEIEKLFEEEEEEDDDGDGEIIEYPPPEMTPPPPQDMETTTLEQEVNETVDTSAECNITVGYLWELCRPVLLKTCKDQYKTVCSTNRRKFRAFSRKLDWLFPVDSPPPMLGVPEPLTDWIAGQVSDLGQEIGDSNFQVSISITEGNNTRTYTNEDFENDLRNLTDFVNDKIRDFNRKYRTTVGNIIERILNNIYSPRHRSRFLPEETRRSAPLFQIPHSPSGRYKRHFSPRNRYGNLNRGGMRPHPRFRSTQARNYGWHHNRMSQDPWARHREFIERMTQKHRDDLRRSWDSVKGIWNQRRMHPLPPISRPSPPMTQHHFPKPPMWGPHFPQQNWNPFRQPPHMSWQVPDEEDEDDDDDDDDEDEREEFSITCEQVEEDPEICVEIVERTEKCEAELEKVCPAYIQARRAVKEKLDRVYDLSQQTNVNRIINEDEDGPKIKEKYEWQSFLTGDEPSILVESINVNRKGSGDAFVRAKMFGRSPFEFRVPSSEFRNNPSSLGKAISKMAMNNYRGIQF